MTAITATPQPATALLPPSMLVQVTGAPNPPAAGYASNFATVDGWANVANATLTANQTLAGVTPKALKIDGPTTLADATVQRALTGLTVGATHRYKATFALGRGEVKLVAKDTAGGAILAQTAFVTYANPSNKTITVQLDYVPTAGNVTIQIVIHQTSVYMASTTATAYAYNVSNVQLGSWLGTAVYRTDVNGIDVPVREDVAGQDTAGGAMTLTDWEAALVGQVTYRVVDGAGASTTSAPVTHAPELRRNVYTNPSLTVDSTSWAAVPQLSGTMSSARLTTGGPVVNGRTLNYFRAQWATISTGGISSTGITFGHPTTTYLPVGAGVPFAVAVYARSNVANRGAQLVVTFHDAAGAQLAVMSSAASTPIGGNVWTLLEASTLLTPAGTVRAYARVYATTGALWQVGDTIDATGVLPAATLGGAYFDGDTDSMGATRYGWTGTPGASSSVELGELAGPAWLLLPATAVPSAGAAGAPSCVPVPLILDYSGELEAIGAMHRVINRVDKIGNPGPLSTRSGTMRLLELDYSRCKAARTLLAGGATAMLRQPAHPGLDLYLVPQRVVEAPADEPTVPLRWTLELGYEEVVAP